MNSRGFKAKIASPQALKRMLAKERGKRVVFTNGCFDIIHAGHVSYLEQARKLGDVLVVAVNTDASVRKLKGPSRPINRLKDRLSVVAGLGAVDYVTWFKELTPESLIKKLRPSVLVKGGDWKPSQIAGSGAVLSWGGKVLSLPYVRGKSSTRVIEQVSASYRRLGTSDQK